MAFNYKNRGPLNLASSVSGDPGSLDEILKNQKQILDSIRMIQEKLGISVERMKDAENPAWEGPEEEELEKKRKRAAMASFKWRATLKALADKRDGEST